MFPHENQAIAALSTTVLSRLDGPAVLPSAAWIKRWQRRAVYPSSGDECPTFLEQNTTTAGSRIRKKNLWKESVTFGRNSPRDRRIVGRLGLQIYADRVTFSCRWRTEQRRGQRLDSSVNNARTTRDERWAHRLSRDQSVNNSLPNRG